MLSHHWMNEGTRSSRVPGIGLGDVLHLMLRVDRKWQFARDRMLDLSVTRLSPLLVGLTGALHAFVKGWRRKQGLDNYKTPSRRVALRASQFLESFWTRAVGIRRRI